MKKYKVYARSISYPYVVIEAESKEDAEDKAREMDGGEFIPDDPWDGVWEIAEDLTEEA